MVHNVQCPNCQYEYQIRRANPISSTCVQCSFVFPFTTEVTLDRDAQVPQVRKGNPDEKRPETKVQIDTSPEVRFPKKPEPEPVPTPTGEPQPDPEPEPELEPVPESKPREPGSENG